MKIIGISNQKECIIYSYYLDDGFFSFLNNTLSFFNLDSFKIFDKSKNRKVSLDDMKETAMYFGKNVVVVLGTTKVHFIIHASLEERKKYWLKVIKK